MTTSYLDDAWFDQQANELTTLQNQLRAHLDVIALAKARVPDLVAQIERLQQREQETLQAVNQEGMKAVHQVQSSLETALISVEGKYGEVEGRLSERSTYWQEALASLSGQLQAQLSEQHLDLDQQLQTQFHVLFQSIPATAQRLEQRASEIEVALQSQWSEYRTTSDERFKLLLEQVKQDILSESQQLQELIEEHAQHLTALSGKLQQNHEALATSVAQQIQEARHTTDLKLAEFRHHSEERSQQVEARLTTLEDQLRGLQQRNTELTAAVTTGHRVAEQLGARIQSIEPGLKDLVAQVNRKAAETSERFQTVENAIKQRGQAWKEALMNLEATQISHQEQLGTAMNDWKEKTAESSAALRQLTEESEKRLKTLVQNEVKQLDGRLYSLDDRLKSTQASLDQAESTRRTDMEQLTAELKLVQQTTIQTHQYIDAKIHGTEARLQDLVMQVDREGEATGRRLKGLEKTLHEQRDQWQEAQTSQERKLETAFNTWRDVNTQTTAEMLKHTEESAQRLETLIQHEVQQVESRVATLNDRLKSTHTRMNQGDVEMQHLTSTVSQSAQKVEQQFTALKAALNQQEQCTEHRFGEVRTELVATTSRLQTDLARLEEQRLQGHQALTEQIAGLDTDLKTTRSASRATSEQLHTFLSWFQQAGALGRMYRKPG